MHIHIGKKRMYTHDRTYMLCDLFSVISRVKLTLFSFGFSSETALEEGNDALFH